MHIFYTPALSLGEDAFISVRKPREVFERVYLPDEDVVVDPGAIRPEAVARVHDPAYVQGIVELRTRNGFGNCERRILSQVLRANAAMVKAALHAAEQPGFNVTFAPVSGFHHAHYDSNYGYCTFNALVIAVESLRRRRDQAALRVLILDGDGHYGDGTEDVLAHHTALQDTVTHVTGQQQWQRFRSKQDALSAPPRWDLILYQAGADAHRDDPYGVGYLDDAAWDERDAWVFGYARRTQSPIAFNLAGGYNGARTIELHARTVAAARRAMARGDAAKHD